MALTIGALAVTTTAAAQQQANDPEYTAKIREYLQDPRISTELVDHLPASSTVPTPLKFLGRIVGTPDELTYARDIHRYLKAVADAAPARAKYWTIGKTEEGRDMVILAVGDEAAIRDLERYKGMLTQLTDPRTTTETQARQLIQTAKPIYWITSGMHSTERGGPEMLMELAYRLVVEETPFIQTIRNNVITFITPVIEVDGRERMVDVYYWNRRQQQAAQPAAGAGAGGRGGGGGGGQLGLMYWGKYVAHDNNRDGMGQFLALTKNTMKAFLDWKPTVLHDLHEQSTYLYSSTGTGPYNDQIDPITVNEWWMLAQADVMEMTKRGVPGVWTYGFYDGWVPNYMFFLAHSHNSIGRFYEVMGYGPQNRTVQGGGATSREWYRPNPALPTIQWGPRNNTNIQQSAILISLNHIGRNKDIYLENYWTKNKNAVNRGRNGPTFGWVIPAAQHRKADAATAVNDLRRQGLEFHVASAPFRAGNVDVKAGDWIVRGDQPYRTLADMYFSVQNYPLGNPSPYDDTGWTFQMMRNLVITPVTDRVLLTAAMQPVTADVRAAGGVTGTGNTLIVAHTSDNNIVTFRFRFPDVRMQAAEAAFEAGGQRFMAGSFIIPNAPRARLEPVLRDLGLTAVAVPTAPTVATHDLDVPRIGYVHNWQNTQNEGWVRAALETYGVPFTYFSDQKLREPNLRQKYDVIVFPCCQTAVGADPPTTGRPLPWMKTAETPHLGYPDSTADTRYGMGMAGLKNLHDFVLQGGTLITEGSTSTLFPRYSLTPAVRIENNAPGLVAEGTILRGIISDTRSPIAYGFINNQLPVYFSGGPLFDAGTTPAPPAAAAAAGGRGGGGRGGGGVWQNTSPMANPLRLATWEPNAMWNPARPTAPANEAPGGGRGGGGRGGGGRGGGGGDQGPLALESMRPRIIMQFPADPADMLLSGTLAGGEALSNRATVIDSPVGQGHVVMFAIRPFWRWQTQGTFILGFNAIMNWNDLNAGKSDPTTGRAAGAP
jgi:hypothetical protein